MTDLPTYSSPSPPAEKCYAQLFHNCTALREIRGPADVREMVPEQRELAKMALRNAQECLQICLHSNSYRWAFNYAVHYTRAFLSLQVPLERFSCAGAER